MSTPTTPAQPAAAPAAKPMQTPQQPSRRVSGPAPGRPARAPANTAEVFAVEQQARWEPLHPKQERCIQNQAGLLFFGPHKFACSSKPTVAEANRLIQSLQHEPTDIAVEGGSDETEETE